MWKSRICGSKNRVSVRWALDPAAAQCRIIKIVLQPLIENAIIHGIFEKPSKCGRLAVAVRREPDGIRITIEDDGIGFDQEMTTRHMGLSNVAKRLTLIDSRNCMEI